MSTVVTETLDQVEGVVGRTVQQLAEFEGILVGAPERVDVTAPRHVAAPH